MARYIDVEPLEKHYQDRFNQLFNKSQNQVGENAWVFDEYIQMGAIIAKEFLDKAQEQPTADVVEVVKCKDCEYWGGITFGNICRRWTGLNVKNCTKPTDYCSYGKARKDAILLNDTRTDCGNT